MSCPTWFKWESFELWICSHSLWCREISRKKTLALLYVLSISETLRSHLILPKAHRNPAEEHSWLEMAAWSPKERQTSHLAVSRSVNVDRLLNLLSFRLGIIKWDCYSIALLNLLAGVNPGWVTVQMPTFLPILPVLSPGDRTCYMVVVTYRKPHCNGRSWMEIHDWRDFAKEAILQM